MTCFYCMSLAFSDCMSQTVTEAAPLHQVLVTSNLHCWGKAVVFQVELRWSDKVLDEREGLLLSNSARRQWLKNRKLGCDWLEPVQNSAFHMHVVTPAPVQPTPSLICTQAIQTTFWNSFWSYWVAPTMLLFGTGKLDPGKDLSWVVFSGLLDSRIGQ